MDEILNNVDLIKTKLNENLTKSQITKKIDGITLEGQINSKRIKFNTVKTELQTLCEEYELLPVSIEQNENDTTLYAIQFPDLNVLYTTAQLESLFEGIYEFLLDGAITKTKMNISGLPTTIDKALLTKTKSSYIKIALDIFCKNSINPYKQNKTLYLQDSDFLKQIEEIYIHYLDVYCEEKNIN